MLRLNQMTMKAFSLTLAYFIFSGCTGGTTSSSIGLSSNSGANSTVPGSSSGIGEINQFYVGINSTKNTVVHVHQTSDFSKNCAVSSSGVLQDINCTVDIPEGELYLKGISLVYNVPPNMCRFLRRRTYWFYNEEVGYGPTQIAVSRVFTDGNLTSYTCSIDGGPASVAACSSSAEVQITDISAAVKAVCIYDRTLAGYHNGCLGNYSLSIADEKIITVAPTSDTFTTNITFPSWGGNFSSIIAGPGRLDWPKDSEGRPLDVVTAVGAGIAQEYPLPAPVDEVTSLTTMEIANAYSSVTPTLHNHGAYFSGSTSKKPYALDPIDDRNGTAIIPGNATYDFDCLDEAFELKQRIRLTVRDWDTYQDFSNYVTSGGATFVPRRFGVNEGPVGSPNCEGIEGPCNDFSGWDDFFDGLGSGYVINGGTIPTRNRYFPYIFLK